MGYCVGGSRQAAIRADCDTRSNLDLGSGGGHGKVEGGQGGGAIRIHMDVEAVIEGRVSADGEDSACIQVETEGPVLDRWDQRPYPGLNNKFTCFTGTKVRILTLTRLAGDVRSETPLFDKTSSRYKYMAPMSGGGGGSGGSIWIIAPRIVGHGVVSATGGSANRSCHTVPPLSPSLPLPHSLPPSL